MKKLISALLIIAMVLSFTVFAFAAERFSDVPSTHKHFEAIESLADLSIINGYPSGEFRPGNSITRAEFTAIICRAWGGELAAEELKGLIAFSDVPATHWASGYINLALYAGVINGMGDGTFAPGANVTYEQAIKMVMSIFIDTSVSQADIDSQGGYPNGYLYYGHLLGLDFNVDGSVGSAITRGMVAQIIHNSGLVGNTPKQTTIPTEPPVEATPEPEPEPEPAQTPVPPAASTNAPSVQQVYDTIMALKSQYPNGMKWDNSNTYTSKYIIGYGCAAFAWILSDAAFGYDAPARDHTDFNNIFVGDILRINNDTHSVIVLEVKSNSVIIAEGNYSGAIKWGREISFANLRGDYVTTRYPEGYTG